MVASNDHAGQAQSCLSFGVPSIAYMRAAGSGTLGSVDVFPEAAVLKAVSPSLADKLSELKTNSYPVA